MIQSDATLDELFIHGHGLNNSGLSRYTGNAKNFQHNIDNTAKYFGPGLEHGKNVLPDVFDDQVLGHALFPVVAINGRLVQLNQNGAPEVSVARAVDLLNEIKHSAAMNAQDFAA
jgi:hypothetical protein